MAKLCLFDASGYIHRAFHAVPPLTTSKGEPVNAVYGFCRMLSKVLKEDKPDYVGVCFDTAAPTFRDEAYKEYKATRSETDPLLVSQLPLAREVAEAWGLPCIGVDGFEADDVIATLAHRGHGAGMTVLILSGDKDILQLVQPGITVRDEIKKVEYNDERVVERYGLKANQLIDYLSLIGDKVDNIPGIPGVGEKTATKLLSSYDTLEGIYEKMNGESPSLKEKLVRHKDDVFRNRDLVTLRADVPLDFRIENLKVAKPDPERLPALITRLEFRGGLYGVDDSFFAGDTAVNTKRTVRTVMTETELKELETALGKARMIAYDVETDGLNSLRCGLVGVSLATRANEGWYIPVGHSYIGVPKQLSVDQVKSAIRPHLENPKILKVGQNLKFDNTVLDCAGIQVKGPFFDTMLAAYSLDSSRQGYGLKDLAADFLKERMTRIDELMGKGKAETFVEVPVEKAAPYAAADAEVSYRLAELFSKKLDEQGSRDLFEKLEMPLVVVLREMEAAGIQVDADYLRAIGKKFDEQRRSIEQEIFKLAGEEFVLNSPKQLARILFEKMKLPPSKKTKTGYSTDEDVLKKLAADNPICAKIIAARELGKLSSTYVEAILNSIDSKSGRIHTSFNQTGTTTGRLSSTNPNLQNIPIRTENGREIRRGFVAAPGHILVSADYSQIDLRVLAHVSKDAALTRTFQAGGDVHTATAAEMFGVAPADVTSDMRRSAKAINFGIVYGQQAFALSQSLGIEMATAKDFIARYFERYAGIRTWMDSTLTDVRKKGYVLTLAGRRRSLPDINAGNAYVRGFAERVAINTPIQGSSADIIKFAMIKAADSLRDKRMKTRMLVQVHDELLFEVPKDELDKAIPLIRSSMESAVDLSVPLIVDVKTGPNWNDMEKILREKAA